MIEVQDVSKTFMTANGHFDALKNVSVNIDQGQLLAITGKSGSGKSTLLNLLSGIDKASKGHININGLDIGKLNESQLCGWRGKNVGIVFQFFQLIPTLTIAENVMLPMDFCNTYIRSERRTRALELLDQVDIADQADKLPATLSGGQQQRVALARALANDPSLIMADEPTGNLDSQNAETIFNLLTRLADSGKTIIVVTHEKDFVRYFKRTIVLTDGRIRETNGLSNPAEVKNVTSL